MPALPARAGCDPAGPASPRAWGGHEQAGSRAARGQRQPCRCWDRAGVCFVGWGDGDSSAVPSLPSLPAPFPSLARGCSEPGRRAGLGRGSAPEMAQRGGSKRDAGLGGEGGGRCLRGDGGGERLGAGWGGGGSWDRGWGEAGLERGDDSFSNGSFSMWLSRARPPLGLSRGCGAAVPAAPPGAAECRGGCALSQGSRVLRWCLPCLHMLWRDTLVPVTPPNRTQLGWAGIQPGQEPHGATVPCGRPCWWSHTSTRLSRCGFSWVL